MIIAGAVILYVTVILFGVDESIVSDSTVNDLCHGRVWLCVIGFSLLLVWYRYALFNCIAV